MGTQYKRQYRVTIYADDVSFQILPTADSGLSEVKSHREIDISELRIKFDITKDIGAVANLCKLEIYNMSRSTRGKIKNEFQRVVIETGHGNELGIIFDGVIRNVFHRRERTDMITEMYIADGDQYLRGSISEISSGENKTVEQLLRETVSDLKNSANQSIPVGEINIESGSNKIKGLVISSSTRDAIEKLANSYDFNWYVMDGKFYAVSSNRTLLRQKVTTISSETGMIESPIITEEGVEVRTLLDRNYAVGATIKIESSGQNVRLGALYFTDVPPTIGEGEFKVRRVVHVGDTRGNDWYSDIEAQRIGFIVTGSNNGTA